MKKCAMPAGRSVRLLLLLASLDVHAAMAGASAAAGGGRFSPSGRGLLLWLAAVWVFLVLAYLLLFLIFRKGAAAQEQPTAFGQESAPTMVISPSGPTQFLENPLAELRVEQGSDKGAVFVVSKNINAIGRFGTRVNDVVLTDRTVSKVQATLYFDPGSGCFSIVNESPKNQTKVNGVIAYQQVPLTGGELIEMGRTALRFKKA
jgi:hypothetical protein